MAKRKTKPKRKLSPAKAREAFLVKHTGLVHSVVKHYMYTGADPEDMAQEGFIGLLRAQETFDPARGVKFSTYAHYGVRCAIRTFLRQQNRHMQAMLLQKEDNGMGGKRHIRQSIARLDAPMSVHGEGVSTLLDQLMSDVDGPEDMAQFHQTVSIVIETLQFVAIQLGDDAVIMAIVANQTSPDPKSLRELAADHGLSFQRIQQREAELLARAREVLHSAPHEVSSSPSPPRPTPTPAAHLPGDALVRLLPARQQTPV